jgi:hypothetical protein
MFLGHCSILPWRLRNLPRASRRNRASAGKHEFVGAVDRSG